MLTIIVGLFLLYGCGSAVIKRDFIGKITVYNFGDRFDLFWEKAQDKNFEMRLKLWNEYVEGRYKSFYNNVIWGTENNPNWEKEKLTRLKVAFKIYETHHQNISSVYKTINKDIKQAVHKFRYTYPSSKLKVSIFIFPFGYESRTAYVSIGNEYKSKTKEIYMAMSPDTITHHKGIIEHILIHELFHVYHAEILGLERAVSMMKERSFSTTLWIEGLAEYHAHHISPRKSIDGYTHDVLEKNNDLKKEVIDMIKAQKTRAVCEKNRSNNLKHVSCRDTYIYAHRIIKILAKTYGLKFLLAVKNTLEIRKLVKTGLKLIGDDKSKIIIESLDK